MKKTLIFALCVFTLLFTLVIFGASADEAATPVSNAAEFKAMTTGGNYILTADIDFGGEVFSKYIFSEFHGTIDGNGKTVKNFSIVGTADGFNAMIKSASGTLIVKNMNIGTAEAPISITGDQKASSGTALILGEGNKEYSAIFSNIDIYININVANDQKCKVAGFVAQSYNTIIEDSNVNGSITVGSTVMYDQYRNVAGFISSNTTGCIVISDSVNNANITLGAGTKEARVAGFVGYSDRAFNLINCVNNGNLTVLDGADGTASAGTQMGGLVAHANGVAVYATNCANNGTLTATTKTCFGNLIGKTGGGAYLLGTTSGENACGLIENNSYAYVEGDYTGYIEVATKEDFLAMTSGNKYRLVADIDLGGMVIENNLFSEFSGVIDGLKADGSGSYKIYNFSIKHTDSTKDSGLFALTKSRIPFVFTNVQIGTPENLVELVITGQTASKSHAILLAGVNASGSAWIHNVDLYGDININPNTERGQAGGFIGYTRHITLDDCNYYGKITLGDFTENKVGSSWWNVAAIGGTVQEVAYIFNCNNYAELTVGNSGAELRLAGILGYCVKPFVLANSNNYGKVSVVTNDTSITSSNTHAAGIVAECNRQTDSLIVVPVIYNCHNYGLVSSDDIFTANFVGSVIARVRNAKQVVVANCENHVAPVGANAGELVGKNESGNFIEINCRVVADFVETPDVTTPSDVTTTVPTDNVTTTLPADDVTTTAPTDDVTTTSPADDVTTVAPTDNDTTTEEPADNTTNKPDDTTTNKPEEPEKKGCGGFAVAAQIIAILGTAVTVIFIKKK